eukprot:1036142-Prymnesium_polylepis.2
MTSFAGSRDNVRSHRAKTCARQSDAFVYIVSVRSGCRGRPGGRARRPPRCSCEHTTLLAPWVWVPALPLGVGLALGAPAKEWLE